MVTQSVQHRLKFRLLEARVGGVFETNLSGDIPEDVVVDEAKAKASAFRFVAGPSALSYSALVSHFSQLSPLSHTHILSRKRALTHRTHTRRPHTQAQKHMLSDTTLCDTCDTCDIRDTCDICARDTLGTDTRHTY